MSRRKEMVAFWLLPAPHERQFLKSLIGRLAERFDAPLFEPHVTLHGGEMDRNQARAALRMVSAQSPFVLEINNISFSETYTKTCFIQFRASAPVRDLSISVAAAAGSNSSYEFDPHLSLIYKNMPPAEKKELADGIELPFRSVTFDSLKAIACPTEIRGREDVEAWRILGERPLAEASI